jgi:hypothetical protein
MPETLVITWFMLIRGKTLAVVSFEAIFGSFFV